MLEDKCFTFPLKPNLAHIMAIEDYDNVEVFTSYEEEDGKENENKVDKLYERGPKEDT